MKRKFDPICLLALLALGTTEFGPMAFGAELDSIPLIATQKYQPGKEENREFGLFFSNLTAPLANVLVGDVSEKIRTESLAKLSTPEMAKYFPKSAEREQIVARIAQEVKKKHLANGTSNPALISAATYSANELIRTVMNRVMEVEGIRDPQRRKLWIDKTLSPINGCFAASRAHGEAAKCLAAFQADLASNLGLAIGYELIKQELGANLAKKFPEQYAKCLQPAKTGAEKRMMGCVLDNVRKNIAVFGEEKLLDRKSVV